MTRMRIALYALLGCAALSRLLLQIAAMPPYAGLDEIYHVARLSFTAQEKRDPSTRELSVPHYLNDSIERKWSALPAFGVIGPQWPDVVKTNPLIMKPQPPITRNAILPYERTNYEAQQSPVYYRAAGPMAALLSIRTAASELQLWRIVSVALALVVVFAAATTAERWFGPIGIAAAALLLSLPTWETLVARAGNDAMACAFVAVAIAITATAPRSTIAIAAEAIAWSAAIATKLYTWPLAAIALVLWFQQRAPRRRVLFVAITSAAVAIVTLLELRSRTGNALGIVAFDQPGGATYDSAVNISEIVRVTIASAAWTSGEHWDALRPIAIAIFLLPVLVLIAVAAIRDRSSRRLQLIAFAGLGAFALAQAFNVVSCVLARRGGNPVPIGGKEGWYWYVLAPLVIPIAFAPAMRLSKWAAIALAIWMTGWDVIIHEGALFHDYAGTTSPAHPSMLFRWGPWQPPFTASLAAIGVGPWSDHLVALRVVHLTAVAALLGLVTVFARKLSHD